jgi:hydrogenase maturation protein HypF
VASIRPFPLLGGDRVAREPWRSALALCFEAGLDWQGCGQDTGILRHAWTRRLNCPSTSSVGRLFDGAAALLGLLSHASYEGQAASHLEAICNIKAESISLPLSRRTDGIWESDWRPLLAHLLDATQSVPARAALFHATLTDMLLAQARAIRGEYGVCRLGLTGGVFQNRRLGEAVLSRAVQDSFSVFLPELMPCNDAGISFGQIVEAGAHD